MTMDAAQLPYRPCVGVMVLNAEGLVFMGKRRSGVEHIDAHHSWQMPQGGIDKGEAPLVAAHRELHEETGIKSVDLLREASGWFAYDLPPDIALRAWKGKYRGQRQRWFAFRFFGRDDEVSVLEPPDGHEPEFSDWAWVPIDEVIDRVIPFKRDVYRQVISEFGHLAAR